MHCFLQLFHVKFLTLSLIKVTVTFKQARHSNSINEHTTVRIVCECGRRVGGMGWMCYSKFLTIVGKQRGYSLVGQIKKKTYGGGPCTSFTTG